MSGLSPAERLRRQYRPSPVPILFVGESPPSGSTFFYRGNSKLFRATKEAFGRAVPALAELEPHAFLEAFRRMGCNVDDLCVEPVDQYDMKDPVERQVRERARCDGVVYLKRRIRRYRPVVITVVMKAIEAHVVTAAEEAGLADVVLPALRFPNWPAATEEYTKQLAKLVSQWDRSGLVATPHR